MNLVQAHPNGPEINEFAVFVSHEFMMKNFL